MQHSLLIAGTRSGSGKTTLTLCLLAALARRGLVVQACKSGPDFIDPTHHQAITGRASYNMDAWMGGEAGMARVYARMLAKGGHMLLAEGAMGLYDGAHGMGGPGSSAHLARSLNMPVLLAIDVRGMGHSAAALAAGYVRQPQAPRFAGLVCTHVGSPAHAALLQEAFAAVFTAQEPPLLGLLPRQGVPELPSRHLGLIMAHEKNWDAQALTDMAQWLEEHMDVQALLHRCTPPSLPAMAMPSAATPAAHMTDTSAGPRIGIAHDAAFCFLYPDMPAVLRELGAQCVFFSPLSDSTLPEGCTALYFPGGYPELHAKDLAANASMRQAVRHFATQRRVYAECGGYIYLMQSLEVDGHKHTMSQSLPLAARLGTRKAALGYREVCLITDENMRGRGHEFHYASLVDIAQRPQLAPLWQALDRKGDPCPAANGVRHGHIWASWVHLYPEGSRQLLRHIFNLNPQQPYFNLQATPSVH